MINNQEEMLQLKINNLISKLENDLIQLREALNHELELIYKKKEFGMKYIPNRCGIVQGIGSEIDMKCRELDSLYSILEQLEYKK